MTRLWLVRHGRPLVDPGQPAAAWALAPWAGAEVAALRPELPTGAAWYCSPEPKASGTARLLTDEPVEVVDDLGEAARPTVWYEDPAEFAALVRRSVLAPNVPAAPGWEPAAATTGRVVRAARRLLDARTGGDVVLVGHGTAWTLLVAALTERPPDLGAWQAMQLPDLALLEVPLDGPAVVRRHWGEW